MREGVSWNGWLQRGREKEKNEWVGRKRDIIKDTLTQYVWLTQEREGRGRGEGEGEKGEGERKLCSTSSDTEENSESLGDEGGESGDMRDLDAIQVALDLRDTTSCCHWLMEEDTQIHDLGFV